MEYAPVVVFVYNRPEHTQQTLDSLASNELAEKTDVFIFCDGVKENAAPETKEKIELTRSVVKQKRNFKSLTISESQINKGLASSIISGVSSIINKYEKIIVLEDDIVTGRYFLTYMNTALELYKNEKKVWHITGWHNPTKRINMNGAFFYPLMDCWGWGTWIDRWSYFRKDPEEIVNKYSKNDIKKFNVDGLVPNKWNQVLGNLNGRNNTWAIFWYEVILSKDGLCLAPSNSLVKNIGCDNSGVHGKTSEHFEIKNDINHRIINFPETFVIDTKEFNLLKRDYKKRFRFERFKQVVKKILPLKIIELYHKYR